MKTATEYVDGVMNYTGSKFKLLDQILPNFNYSKTYFVDLFCGGGSVYTNVLDKYYKILANDIISDIIGIHNGIITSDSIIDETIKVCPVKGDKEAFLKLREDYNNNPAPEKLWALILSSTNNMIRFNQKLKYNQTYGERGWNSNTYKKVEEFKNHIRKYSDKIFFKSLPFNEILINNSDTMVYIDPPYGRIDNNGEIGNKQISEAGYNAFWKKDDDIKLYNYIKRLDKIGASFMISGVLEHDGHVCWILNKLIKDGFNYKEIKFDYNKVSRKGDKETKEVIIMNY